MLGIYARTSREREDNEQSTIEQQIKAGIAFAKSKLSDYEIYSDRGISGYKISQEEKTDPYSNRPEFMRMVEDIKSGKVTSVWVWEHSRLSRNAYTSGAIFNIFAKYNVELFEKDKKYDYKDPSNTVIRQIMDAIAEYERNLIIGRTTRGLYNAIDNGKRSFGRFYGYKANGRNEQGYRIYVPVESEMKKLEYAYKTFSAGASLRQIALKFFDTALSKDEQFEVMRRTTHLGKILKHAEYTGKALNTKGLEIIHKFEKNEIDSIAVLANLEYWVEHQFYTRQVVSIDDWIKVRERLQDNTNKKRSQKRNRAAKESLGTGLMRCNECGCYYYYTSAKKKAKNPNQKWQYYFHQSQIMNKARCSNKHTVKMEIFDTIANIFYLYYSLMYDTSNEELEEHLKKFEIELLEKSEVVKSTKKQIATLNRQIEKMNKAIDTTEDLSAVTVLAKRISKIENEIEAKQIELLHCENEVENAKNKYKQTELKKSLFIMRDNLIDYFEKFTNPRRREVLSKFEFINYNGVIAIFAKNTIMLFDASKTYTFPTELYEKIKNDKHFTNFTNFIERNGKDGFYFLPMSFATKSRLPYKELKSMGDAIAKIRKDERWKNIDSLVLMYPFENEKNLVFSFKKTD